MGCEIRRPETVTFHIGSSVGGPTYNKLFAIPNVDDVYPAAAVMLINDSAMLVLIEEGMPEIVQSLIIEVSTKHCTPSVTSISRSTARAVYAEIFDRIAVMVEDGTLKNGENGWESSKKPIPKEMMQ